MTAYISWRPENAKAVAHCETMQWLEPRNSVCG
jgi:hypothetical protein